MAKKGLKWDTAFPTNGARIANPKDGMYFVRYQIPGKKLGYPELIWVVNGIPHTFTYRRNPYCLKIEQAMPIRPAVGDQLERIPRLTIEQLIARGGRLPLPKMK